MTPSRIDLLQAMPVFGGVRDDILSFLLDHAPIISVAADDYFFREGEAGDAMFVLEHGEVTVSKTCHHHEYVLRQLGRGDAFGEMALIDLFPRSANVKALTDCQAIELTSDLLYKVYERDLEQFTMIQMNVAREISRRLRVADERLFRAQLQLKLDQKETSAYHLL